MRCSLLLILVGCHRRTDDTDVLPHSTPDTGTDTVLPHTGLTGQTGETGETGTAMTDEELLKLGVTWGVPLVVSGRNLNDRPYNELTWNLDQAGPTDGRSGAPNPDVVYAISFVDLRDEPVYFKTPDIVDGRYWSVQMDTLWSVAFRYVGKRATGGYGGEYLLTPPGYTGDLHGLEQIEVPSTQAVFLTRIHVTDRDDRPNAVALTSGFDMMPLHEWLEDPDPNVYGPAPIPNWGTNDGSVGMNGIEFWDELCDLLVASPPVAKEQPFLDSLARFGIVPGHHPSTEVTDQATKDLLASVVEPAMQDVLDAVDYNIWVPVLNIGVFDNWTDRASSSTDGWIAHPKEEGVYASSPLLAADRVYRLHFDADKLPDVDGFWSITTYDRDRFLLENPIDRYSVNSGDPDLVYNPDGSIDLRIAPTLVEGEGFPIANWVPTNTEVGELSVMFRAYIPGPDIQSGAWQLPPIVPDP